MSIIRRNNFQSAYTLHILNFKHEYGTIGDTMTLLKHIDKPSLFLPYKQLYIKLFHHNNQLIPEQHPNEQNPMFQLLYNRYHTTHPSWHPNQYLHLNMEQPISFHPAYQIVSYTGTSTDISAILLLHYL